MTEQPRKQVLIATAARLFNKNGYHATGIDMILAEAGVSKATLYKHFRSKEELILAVLKQRHDALMTALVSRCETVPVGSKRALVLFDLLHEWFQSKAFCGCLFIRASAEYASFDADIVDYAAGHKEEICTVLAANLVPLPARSRSRLANELLLLAEGAIVSAQVRRDANAAKHARAVAERLLAAAGSAA